MSLQPSNFSLPAGITEADLVDLVDGCLASDREAVVAAAVKADPRLRAMVGAMQTDRAALAECALVQAPAGMAEEIEARLQAEALRGLATASEEAPASIPISSVQIKRPVVWPRRFAMAASIAIVGAGATWGAYQIARGWGRSSAPAPVEVVRNTPTHVEPSAITAPDPIPSDLTLVDNNSAVAVAPAPTIAAVPTPEPIDETRALALAREGRLVITIHATTAQPTVKRLETLAKAGSREGWRTIALDNVPAEYAALTTPSVSFTPSAKLHPNEPAFASEKPVGSAPKNAPQDTASLRPTVKAIYTAEVNPGDRWVSGLIRTVTDALPEGAILELREGPSIASSPAVDADSVLWWNSPSAKWSKKTTVPIVVEGLE
jgi:hypothetical protein